MNIGIYTIHACNNFGAVLQAYATARYLKELGYKAELVNVVTPDEEKRMHYLRSWNSLKGVLFNIYSILNPKVRRKVENFKRFRDRMPLSKRYRSYNEIINNTPIYDLHLVGSDQVWNVENGIGNAYFFLPSLSSDQRCISYASSFGNVNAIANLSGQIKKYLSNFKSISVREQDANDFIINNLHLSSTCVLDPTFLLDASEWSEIAGDKPLIEGGYILYYGFDNNHNCAGSISLLSDKLDLPVVGVSGSLHSPFKFDKFYKEAGPEEFLNLIRNASFIITSSFHGMALSINFRKDFAVLKHGTRMSRMESMLAKFSLSNRIVSNPDELNELIKSSKSVDYESIEPIIVNAVSDSQNWLHSATKSNML